MPENSTVDNDASASAAGGTVAGEALSTATKNTNNTAVIGAAIAAGPRNPNSFSSINHASFSSASFSAATTANSSERELAAQLLELQPHLQPFVGRKRPGRPAGKKDAAPRKKPAISFRSVSDKKKVQAARQHMVQVERAKQTATQTVEQCQRDLLEAQRKFTAAQTRLGEATAASNSSAETVADDLLLEPTHWNKTYQKLLLFRQREGHLTLKRHMPHVDPPQTFSCEESKKQYKALARWSSHQRTAKRQNTLEPYQEYLLNRIQFDWEPRGGPGPQKWQQSYLKYCEFKRIHGRDAKVTRNVDKELHRWTVVQASYLRNRATGKYPSLSEERERLLNEVGFDWGVAQVVIPWETRFRELQHYKAQFGHCNVPWRWITNRPLAGWVNVQRNKYRDKNTGKNPTAITDDQIRQLNEIGFRWSTEGKGRYIEEEDQASSAESH